MVLLEKLWDDVLAGPQPERGLGKFRKISTKPISIPAPGIYIYIYIKENSIVEKGEI